MEMDLSGSLMYGEGKKTAHMTGQGFPVADGFCPVFLRIRPLRCALKKHTLSQTGSFRALQSISDGGQISGGAHQEQKRDCNSGLSVALLDI